MANSSPIDARRGPAFRAVRRYQDKTSFGLAAETLKGVIAQQLLVRADGAGRVVAVEILVGTIAVANLIREGKTYQIPSLIQTGRREGMQTMDQAILELLRNKQITPQEAYRKAIDKETYRHYLERL